jgi:OmcA/MtrC family decaheme c-type cytochrome
MKLKLVRYGTAALAAIAMALAGCGGGGGGEGGGGTDTPTPPPAQPVQQALSSAAALAANDTATNPTAAFSVLQGAGVPVVTVNSPPVVNFAVFSDGALKTGLALSNVSFVLAKLVPGTNGDPDKWVSYTYRTESTASGTAKTGPGGVPVLASALQATSDTKLSGTSTAALTQLVYNPDGYYTYTFSTDIKDPTKTQGVTFEPNLTHRIAIQLSYTNAAGATVRVNPYYDFTFGADGKSVPVTAAQTRQMVDIKTCNGCHDKLALHGGGRVDTQFCVLCHNPSTVDAQSGNNLNLATMVHKIHSGRELHENGENYVIWGNSASKHDYSEVGFPQPTRNCASCHTGSNPVTPQGDNWKTKVTKEACLSCHQSGATSSWFATHVTTLKLGSSAAATPNSSCASCHGPNSSFSPEKAHWVQEMANASLYKGVIESVTLTKAPTATATGTISVKYAVINPATGAAYNLSEGCTGAATTDQKGTALANSCNTSYRWDAVLPPALPTAPQDKFGTFTLGLATNTLAQIVDDTTGTAGGVLPAYRGVNDGSNHYTMDVTVPAGSKGNARLMLLGSVAERRLDPLTRAAVGAVPPTKNSDLAYVPVKNAIWEFNATTGAKATTTARRQIVSNDSCNSCHGILGLPTGPNDAEHPGFHKGVRNNSEGCANCHNANQAGGYTLMADGSTGPVAGDSQLAAGNTSSFLHESYQAKRFVHGIHAGAKRVYPFTHCMNVGGEYNKDGTSKTVAGLTMGAATCVNQYPGVTDNFTAEVAYPAQIGNCSNCHVNDSWKQDKSVLGSVVFKPTGVTNMLDWYVISPKAATCTSCHDSKAAQTHVKTVGASFGTATQDGLLNKGAVFESCEGCHAPGSAIGVDTVHGLR